MRLTWPALAFVGLILGTVATHTLLYPLFFAAQPPIDGYPAVPSRTQRTGHVVSATQDEALLRTPSPFPGSPDELLRVAYDSIQTATGERVATLEPNSIVNFVLPREPGPLRAEGPIIVYTP